MKGWQFWGCFKRSFFFPTKLFLLKMNSRLMQKPRGNGNGLLSLYKDIESCGEYRDIQVMWDIIHSCPDPQSVNVKRRSNFRLGFSAWRFCFQPS